MKPEDKTTIKNENAAAPEKQAAPKEQPQKAQAPKPLKKKSGFKSMLQQIGLALLFLAIGALAIVLSLYLPMVKKNQTAQSELDRLVPIETQYLELQEFHSQTQAKAMVYKLMSDTSRLQEAISGNNSERVNQYLIYLEDDLEELVISELPDLPSNLSAQFEKIKTKINSSPATASGDLQDFYNDLLLLADNL